MRRYDPRNPAARMGALGGFTMVELMAVMVILVVAILGFVFGLGVNVQETSATKQSYVALNAARSKIEELKGHKFRRILRDFGPSVAENRFAVTYEEDGTAYTLTAPNGDPAGQLIFCTDETNIPADFGWGTSYDLDGDGAATSTDVGNGYQVLPVIVRVRWIDALGERQADVKTVLFDPKYPPILD